MQKKTNNPIIAYWRESKGGRYLQVSIDNEVLRDAMMGKDGKTSLAVFFNTNKKTEKTPDIVVKAATGGTGTQKKESNAGSPFPFAG